MINDTLDFSKIEAGKAELEKNLCDLAALLKEISAMIRSRTREKGPLSN
jgi:signal transduction histidine kinase